VDFGILISLGYKVSGLKFPPKKTKAIPVLSIRQPICVMIVSGDRQSDGTNGQKPGILLKEYTCVYIYIYIYIYIYVYVCKK